MELGLLLGGAATLAMALVLTLAVGHIRHGKNALERLDGNGTRT